MATSEQTLSFGLSHDELAALLNLLQLPTLPGMADDLAATYQTDEMRLVLLAGQRSLEARGMIDVQPDAVQVDQMIAGVIYSCAAARSLFMIADTAADGSLPSRTLYYVGERLLVEWITTPTGIHRLRLLPDFKTVASAMVLKTGVTGDAPPAQDYTIPQAWFELYRNARLEQQSGLDALQAAGASTDEAGWLDKLISGLTTTRTVLGLNLRDEAAGSNRAFNVLHSQDAYWLMQDAPDEKVAISPADGVMVARAVKDVLRDVMPEVFNNA